MFEEHCQKVRVVKPGVRRGRVHCPGIGDEGRSQHAKEADDGSIGDATSVARAGKGFGHEQHDAQQHDKDLKVERVHGVR